MHLVYPYGQFKAPALPVFECISRAYCTNIIVIVILSWWFDFSVKTLVSIITKLNGNLKIDSDNFKYRYRKSKAGRIAKDRILKAFLL